MFDDSRIRKLKKTATVTPTPTPVQIFQKLPGLRPSAKVLKISNPQVNNFSEFSIINQMQFPLSKPPQVPLSQRTNNSTRMQASKLRSVSFIDFSEALSTVAKISKIEEQYCACNGVLNKLMKNNRLFQGNYFNLKGERKKNAEKAPIMKKRTVSIFNYPILKMNESQKLEAQLEEKEKEKEKEKENEKEKVTPKIYLRKKTQIMEIPNEILEKNHISMKNIDEKNKTQNISCQNNVVKRKVIERAKSSMQRNEKTTLNYIKKKNPSFNNKENDHMLFLKVREKICSKEKITNNIANAEIKKKEKEEKVIVNKEIQDSPDDKNLIEPWNVQDSQSEENI